MCSKLVLHMGQWTTQGSTIGSEAMMRSCEFLLLFFLVLAWEHPWHRNIIWYVDIDPNLSPPCPDKPPRLFVVCGNHFSNGCIWTWYQFWNTGVYFFVGTRKSKGRYNNLVQNSKNFLSFQPSFLNRYLKFLIHQHYMEMTGYITCFLAG